MERKVRDSCGKTCLGETPQAEAEEAPQTARGKRVPEVEVKSTMNIGSLITLFVKSITSLTLRYMLEYSVVSTYSRGAF
ncbi:hypothetical protein [Peribacillus frigoritolerans]|uniref:Uncharacterized protein n=1 Tax=Peribacillus castrilensis TaxID=2897690 RepID=A0AAW9NDU0_9BACI|nr:hypothetical protein [Peribacillus castrilensis]